MLLAAAALLTLILTRDFVALGLVLLFAGSGLERFVGLMAILPAALACVVLFRVGKHTLARLRGHAVLVSRSTSSSSCTALWFSGRSQGQSLVAGTGAERIREVLRE